MNGFPKYGISITVFSASRRFLNSIFIFLIIFSQDLSSEKFRLHCIAIELGESVLRQDMLSDMKMIQNEIPC